MKLSRLLAGIVSAAAVLQLLLMVDPLNDPRISGGPMGPLDIQLHQPLYGIVTLVVVGLVVGAHALALYTGSYGVLFGLGAGCLLVVGLFKGLLPDTLIFAWPWLGSLALLGGLTRLLAKDRFGIFRKQTVPSAPPARQPADDLA